MSTCSSRRRTMPTSPLTLSSATSEVRAKAGKSATEIPSCKTAISQTKLATIITTTMGATLLMGVLQFRAAPCIRPSYSIEDPPWITRISLKEGRSWRALILSSLLTRSRWSSSWTAPLRWHLGRLLLLCTRASTEQRKPFTQATRRRGGRELRTDTLKARRAGKLLQSFSSRKWRWMVTLW